MDLCLSTRQLNTCCSAYAFSVRDKHYSNLMTLSLERSYVTCSHAGSTCRERSAEFTASAYILSPPHFGGSVSHAVVQANTWPHGARLEENVLATLTVQQEMEESD